MENHDINPTEQYDPLGRDEPAEDPHNVLPMDDAVAEGMTLRAVEEIETHLRAAERLLLQAEPSDPSPLVAGRNDGIHRCKMTIWRALDELGDLRRWTWIQNQVANEIAAKAEAQIERQRELS